MKLQSIELPLGKNQPLQKSPKIVLLVIFTLVFLTVVPYYPLLIRYPSNDSSKTPSSSSYDNHSKDIIGDDEIVSTPSGDKFCDIFSGEWIPNPHAPYYKNTTCWAIHEHQNCMKYGRPDSDFMKWRWKPSDCDLPIFNPAIFLELVRGKSLAFVGDSVGRNQMQSLICLLSRVEYPIGVSHSPDERFIRWKYTSYNFTLAAFWTPHLVKSNETDVVGSTHNVYLDEFDEKWTTQIDEFDFLIISAGHWFFRPMIFYEDGKIVGCHYCQQENVIDLTMQYGYRKAFRTAFKAINGLENYKGITYLRTFAPSHFEGWLWDQGGNCVRTRPFRNNETRLEGQNLELYMAQVEEFNKAEKEGKKKGLRYRLLDTTQTMLLRPDGHPSRYGHWPNENVTLYNDCVHWCLPGPIDIWNDFLLEMLKREGVRSHVEKLQYLRDRKLQVR